MIVSPVALNGLGGIGPLDLSTGVVSENGTFFGITICSDSESLRAVVQCHSPSRREIVLDSV